MVLGSDTVIALDEEVIGKPQRPPRCRNHVAPIDGTTACHLHRSGSGPKKARGSRCRRCVGLRVDEAME